VIGSLGGVLLGAWFQRESKKIGELERKVERYRKETQAHQKEEEVAAAWLFQLGQGTSELAVKRPLRRRTVEKTGFILSVSRREANPS
jgi:hypothetical protein